MIARIISMLDRTTMYRLVLYYLLALFALAVCFGALGVLPYAPLSLLYSAGILLVAAWVTNEAFAWLFGATTNHESALITALILALIVSPVIAGDGGGALLLSFIAGWAVASKYLISWHKTHLFNPAALAVALSALTLGVSATWWAGGNLALLPFVLLGGLAVLYKLRRFDVVLSFALAVAVAVAATATDVPAALQATFLHSAFFFFAFVMLTEPLTMPPTRTLRVFYGALVGVLFVPAAHLGSLYFSPELALLAGNLLFFFSRRGGRYTLTLVGRHKRSRGIYEFVFTPDRPLAFRPGQYLEWTLPGVPLDSRGNRRYFTIASAPEDPLVRLGVRFYEKPSAYKRTLAGLSKGGALSVASLSGDFTLPKDTKRKLAFIAGGVGVTPFASMARHMSASGERRDAVLLYSSRTAEDVAYQDVFANAAREGLRSVYVLTDEAPQLPGALRGPITAALVKREIPDYRERLFYLSGPPGMVDAMKAGLRSLGVSPFSIQTDYFPGLA